MYKPKVFLSGGFKSNWQDKLIEKLGNEFLFFDPRKHQLNESNEYALWDVHFVKQADIFFGYMESSNPSGMGLIFELGVAYGSNKTIILVDEKSSTDRHFERYFKIVRNSSHILFENIDDAIVYLESFHRYK